MSRTYRGLTAEQRAADRRHRLVAAAIDAFADGGYASATIERICRGAGVTARHFYEHFATREALLLAAYEEIIDGHRGAVLRALAEAPGDALEPRVRAAVGAALDVWTQDRGRARIVFIEIVGVSPAVEARRLRAVDEYTELVSAIGDDFHARGLAGRPGNTVAARAVVGALIGLVELWLTAPEPPPTAELRDEATRLVVAALA